MSQKCVVTFTWMISGHGLVLRYATDTKVMKPGSNEEYRASVIIKKEPEVWDGITIPKPIRYIPLFDVKHCWMTNPDVWNKIDYLSMAKQTDNAKAFSGTGWQAQEMIFKDIFANSTKSQEEIEKACQINATTCHYKYDTKWSIYENIMPWEKYFTGYKKPDASGNEKEMLTNAVEEIERDGKKYYFNMAIDPNVGTRPNGGAFCRLMLINIENETGEISNIYYGDKTKVTLESNEKEDAYGFNLGNNNKSLTNVADECYARTRHIIRTELGKSKDSYIMRMFIYDTTCNGYKRWITPDEEKTFHMTSNSSGGGIQNGGTINVEESIADLERIMKEQSESMKDDIPDPYNVGLNILFDLKELTEKENDSESRAKK
jgi:hypothetical protein